MSVTNFLILWGQGATVAYGKYKLLLNEHLDNIRHYKPYILVETDLLQIHLSMENSTICFEPFPK